MPRELLIASARPVDLVDLLGSALLGPASQVQGGGFSLRSIWSGGATQLVADSGQLVLTVLRSTSIGTAADLASLIDTEAAFLTEVYVPWSCPSGDALADALVSALGGFSVVGGPQDRAATRVVGPG